MKSSWKKTSFCERSWNEILNLNVMNAMIRYVLWVAWVPPISVKISMSSQRVWKYKNYRICIEYIIGGYPICVLIYI